MTYTSSDWQDRANRPFFLVQQRIAPPLTRLPRFWKHSKSALRASFSCFRVFKVKAFCARAWTRFDFEHLRLHII